MKNLLLICSALLAGLLLQTQTRADGLHIRWSVEPISNAGALAGWKVTDGNKKTETTYGKNDKAAADKDAHNKNADMPVNGGNGNGKADDPKSIPD